MMMFHDDHECIHVHRRDYEHDENERDDVRDRGQTQIFPPD